MFRGSTTLSSAQLMDSIGITGGAFDAETESNVTQYYFTVPSAYLDIALRAERSRAEGLLLTPELWGQERGAIIQEVKQDDSNAFYRLFTKMQNRLIGGTPYAKNTLGTVAAFDTAVNSTQLRKFYQEWYHPNNAVYVIAGNVDPQATIAKVRELFGDLPAVALPAREPVTLRPLRPALYHDSSDQAYTAVLLGLSLSRLRQPGLRRGRDPERRAQQPAQRLRRIGLHRKSAGDAVRYADLSEGRHRHCLRRGARFNAAGKDRRTFARHHQEVSAGRRAGRSRCKPQSCARSHRSSSTRTRSRDKPSNGVRPWPSRASTRPTI